MPPSWLSRPGLFHSLPRASFILLCLISLNLMLVVLVGRWVRLWRRCLPLALFLAETHTMLSLPSSFTFPLIVSLLCWQKLTSSWVLLEFSCFCKPLPHAWRKAITAWHTGNSWRLVLSKAHSMAMPV